MSKWLALLRRCMRRQLPKEGELLDLTPVGHALLFPGEEGYQAVLYWVSLPCRQLMPHFAARTDQWHRAVLFWHGREGFSLRWVPLKPYWFH